MQKLIIAVALAASLSACSGILERQEPVCQATANIGGMPQTVQIYGVRTVANQIEYRAGYPFDWRWVNKNNFTVSTCK